VHEVTFSSVKWPHLAGGEVEIVRAAVGRIGNEEVLQRDDEDLTELVRSEVARAAWAVGEPIATRVCRFTDSLPQYTVGHLDRVERIKAAVAEQPGLAVAGAAYEGVGVGNCVTTARKATTQVLSALRKRS